MTTSDRPPSPLHGILPDGREARLHVLEAPGGWRAEVSDYGATLVRLLVPAGDGGPPVDVVLGAADLAGYRAGRAYLGATCGRVANRIAGGTFDLDGTRHVLACNDGPHHLHGGRSGFDARLWRGSTRWGEGGPAVDLELVSPAGDEGYPGRLVARVTYTLSPGGELRVEMSAATDAATLVNMAHHSYWNLGGHDCGTIRDHELTVVADRYLPVDAGGIPTGEQRPVAGTPFDFRPERATPATLGAALDALPPGGIDHDFVVRGWRRDGAVRPVARLREPRSGRTLEVLSDQPGLQVYTGNHLDGSVAGKAGAAYARHAGVCLETQFHPDAIHHPGWPSPRLDPGATYRHTMIHRITTG